MTLQEQKLEFEKSDKGKRAIEFAKKYFHLVNSSFNSFVFEPYYLQQAYMRIKNINPNYVSLNFENELNDYNILFWTWFYNQVNILEYYNQSLKQEKDYKLELERIKQENENIFSLITTLPKIILFIIIGFIIIKIWR